MIGRENYYEKIKGIDFSQLDEDMNAMKDMVDKITFEGSDWTAYENDSKVKETFDLYFRALELELKEIVPKAVKKSSPAKKTQPKPTAKKSTPQRIIKKQKTETKTVKASSTKKTKVDPNAQKVEVFSLEHKFIKRFVNLDGKGKKRNQVRLFISALQKAIKEKKIRKGSKYAKEIMQIQDDLIQFHSKFRNEDQLKQHKISAQQKANYLKILGRQIEMPSVKLIKSYINLQGKVIPNIKAKNLYNRIVRAFKSKKVSKKDKYIKELESILEKLETFIKKNKSSGLLSIEPKALNGLGKIIGMAGIALSGFASPVPSDAILTGEEIAQLKFDTLEFEGKWKEFMGQPNRGFSFMLSAKPKFGKTILALQFADYLAKNFGTVLYIASEEQIGATLQRKVLEGKYFHPDLFFTGTMPENFDAFDFVFIDSVNNYGLTVEDLKRLKKENPTTSFGYIFQVTKNGVFRGSNEFQHDVDSIWEIPEKGQAIQFGRFNQGGAMNVFEDSSDSSLDGVKKKCQPEQNDSDFL